MKREVIGSPIAKKTLIGQRVKKPDAPEKATGRRAYINDMVLPQMLIGKVLFAGRPHARIVRIDTSAAEKQPGVYAVLTGKDAAGLKFGFVRETSRSRTRWRCEHDEIAAGRGQTDGRVAARALELIEVEYEDLPAWSHRGRRQGRRATCPDTFPATRASFRFKHGDLACGRSGLGLCRRQRVRPHHVTHCWHGHLLRHRRLRPNGKLTIWTRPSIRTTTRGSCPALG